MCHQLKQNRVEICGIQETRLKHEKNRKEMVNSYPLAFGYTMYTVSACENERNASTGGLGLILEKRPMSFLWALNESQIES